MLQFDEAYLEYTLRTAFESPEHFKLPKGVIRYDYGSTHAWWARVTRDRATFKQMYYDGQSGSIENGLRLAILYRHEVLSAFPNVTITRPFKRAISQDPEKRIRRVIEPGSLNSYIAWVATWHDADYQRKEKNFSVRKFGEDEARRLALEAATVNHNPIPKEYFVEDSYEEE